MVNEVILHVFLDFFSRACDFMTSCYLIHVEGWSMLKEICPMGWSMIKVVIMRVFLDIFSRARDFLTSCYLSLSEGWSRLKVVVCLT